MTYRIFNWEGEEPYRDRNQREKVRKGTGTFRSQYPWANMKPGQSFFVAIDNYRDSKEIRSKVNTIRNSARNFGIWVKCYTHNSWRHLDGKPGIKVIHDGEIR